MHRFARAAIFGIACCTVLISALAEYREVPDFIHICHRSDPELEACITRSVENLRPKLESGVPEYNIPSLEPLLLKELVAAEGTGGIRITATDVLAYGASNFLVQKIRADLQTQRFAVDILLPHLYIEGQYNIDGRVLLLPIRGSGPMTGNFTDATGSCKIQAAKVTGPDNVERFHIEEFRMKISMRHGSLYLSNLFGGDPTLGQVVNGAINSNFDAFLKELSPLIEKALADAFLKISNNIVTPFTYDQLFPA